MGQVYLKVRLREFLEEEERAQSEERRAELRRRVGRFLEHSSVKLRGKTLKMMAELQEKLMQDDF